MLLSRIDIHARKQGMTQAQVVIQACRDYLDPKVPYMAGDNSTRVGLGSPPEPAPKPNMEALRAICAGSQWAEPNEALPTLVLCPKTGYNETDGETYRCSLAKGHKPPCRPGEMV